MKSSDSHTILVVDDDDVLRGALTRALTRRGHDVRGAASAEEALTLARADSPELAVVDLRMPGAGGLELLVALKENDPATRVVVLTGYGSIATAVEAMRLGATHYVSKPADADEVLAAFGLVHAPSADDHDVGTPTLARAEWEHIQRVMADCGGNVSEAARRLGLHRRSLQRKLMKYPPNH